MSRIRKNCCFLAGLALLLLTAIPSWSAEVKVALDCPADLKKCGSYLWSYYFAEHLKVNGMKVELMPNDSIGGEEEKLYQLQNGLLEVTGCSTMTKAGQLDPFILGFFIPYLFDDMAHADRVVENTDLVAKANAGLIKKGVRLLSLVAVGGFVGIANTKRPIYEPADMKGLRIRAMDKQQTEFLKAWGANSVVIPFSEIYNGLQTGITDGYMNPAIVPIMFKHTELIKHFAAVRMNVPFRLALCSESWYQGLSKKERTIVDEAASKANEANRVWQAEIEESGLNDLRKSGLKVTIPSEAQRAKFAELLRPVLPKLFDPEMVKIFIAAADKYR